MSFYRLFVSQKSLLCLFLVLNIGLFMTGVVRLIHTSFNPTQSHHEGITNSRNLMGREPCLCEKDADRGIVKNPAVKPPAARMGQDFNSSAEYQVPNLVHYIWYNEKSVPLQWHHMLCIISAHKFINPDVLYFHTNSEPTGPYWERLKSLPKLRVVHRDPPFKVYGEDVKKPFYYTSHSNVDRVVVLMEYGGIYLDADVLIVKPFDHLRKYPCTIGLERSTQACGSVIVGSKDSFFLRLWINSYLDDYRIEEWAYNTGKVPFKLWKRFPELVHVEETRMNRPNFKELDQIYGTSTWDWQNNYSVHLWYRLWKEKSPNYHGVEPNDDNIKTWNGTFGKMARVVLYGSPDIVAT